MIFCDLWVDVHVFPHDSLVRLLSGHCSRWAAHHIHNVTWCCASVIRLDVGIF